MGKKLEKFKNDNFENMKVGFLLELSFRQNSINEQLSNFIDFLKDNNKFLSNIDSFCLIQGIDNFNNLFYNFTDLIFFNVDKSEKFCKYHKNFY